MLSKKYRGEIVHLGDWNKICFDFMTVSRKFIYKFLLIFIFIPTISLGQSGVKEEIVDFLKGKNVEDSGFKEAFLKFYDSLAVTLNVAIDFVSASEEIFYPNSSEYASDEILIALFEKFVNRPDIEDLYKIRPNYFLGNLYKNRVGEKATDFEFLKWEGDRENLYDIEAEKIILIFGSESCPDCAKAKRYLERKINAESVENKKVVMLYISLSTNLDFWKKSRSVSQKFIYGFDINRNITDRTFDYRNSQGPFYHLKQFPIIYVIDGKTKRVIAKEISAQKCLMYL